MKKVFALALAIVAIASCKKDPIPAIDYRNPFTGYYPVRAACTDYEDSVVVRRSNDSYLLKVQETGDSSLLITFFRDSAQTSQLQVNVNAAGSFRSDSIPGKPRAYQGKFTLPSSLYFTTFEGNALGSTACIYDCTKLKPLE